MMVKQKLSHFCIIKNWREAVLRTIKNRANKATAIFASLLLTLCLVPVAAFGDTGTARVELGVPAGGIPAEGYESGDEIIVPVVITENPGFTGFSFTVKYNMEVFECLKIDDDNSIIPRGWLAEKNLADYESGGCSYISGTSGGNFTGTGELYKVTLKVKETAPAGSYTLGLITRNNNPDNFVGLNDELETVRVDVAFSVPMSLVVAGDTPPPLPPAQLAVGAPSPLGTQLPGAEFTVPVTIAANPGFMGASFTLGFDESALELTALSATGTAFEDYLFDVDLSRATVGFIGASGGGGGQIELVEGNGTLFNATFKVKEGAAPESYNITVGLTDDDALNFVDGDGDELAIEFSAGSVTIGAALAETTFIVGSANGKPGEEVRVPVTVEGNSGFAGALVKLLVSPSDALEYITVEATGYLAEGALTVDGVFQNFVVLAIISSEDITEDGHLFDLVFKIGDDVADDTEVTIELAPRWGDGTDFVAVDPDDPENTLPVNIVFEAGTLTVNEELLTPTVDDLTYEAPPWSVTYDGTPQSVAVTPNAGIGAVTVFYAGIDSTTYPKTQTAPTNAGSYAVSVNIASSPGYTAATDLPLGTLTISKAAAPTIVWPTAAPIKYAGNALSTVPLVGGSTEYGTFAWTNSSTIPTVPGGNYGVTFTPTYDTANYELPESVTSEVALTVNKGDAPTIVWPTTASKIRTGQPLSASILSGGSTEYGTFAWTDGSIEPSASGNQEVTLTPTYDTANYELPTEVTANVYVTVVIAGDVNGDGRVTAADALLTLRAAVGLITLPSDMYFAANVDGDAAITSADAIYVARKALGL
jgi:hypothetical protein